MTEPLELVRRPHRRCLVEWGQNHPEALVLSADLSSSCEADAFGEAFADRFLSMGMAEQNMMGFAAGLAREGFIPFVHTFAVFVTRRPFDQVAMSIAYPALPVRLFGFVPGITTPGGATHQAIEDLATFRALPNMTVLECGDATEVESLLPAIEELPGPVYVRMLRGEVPRLFRRDEPLEVGRCRVLDDGVDLVVVTSGICTEPAIDALRLARQATGLSIGHFHVSTLKPFDVDGRLAEAVCTARQGVVTLENHSIIGGLGSAVAEVMAESGASARLLRLGIGDTFSHGASRRYLMAEHGLDGAGLVAGIEKLLGRELGIARSALDGQGAERRGDRSLV